ncbi:hypothetical protein QBC37DRAFT_112929 [Rhypophila decipiens]|uniref:Uncharacterized protein n=1 Tax=Rhypophila decipiens TaxID=261697 RepID=A0AAN6YAX1_9PEZI|nr:hypothetical protein QBC37DRAFT_112929 [Rhypophila decipiens]
MDLWVYGAMEPWIMFTFSLLYTLWLWTCSGCPLLFFCSTFDQEIYLRMYGHDHLGSGVQRLGDGSTLSRESKCW